jgi:hypothetical protein
MRFKLSTIAVLYCLRFAEYPTHQRCSLMNNCFPGTLVKVVGDPGGTHELTKIQRRLEVYGKNVHNTVHLHLPADTQ